MASNLAALQAALQQDIISGGTDVLPLLSVPDNASPEKRLFVYQNAYVARLVEFLCEDFDTTWTFLGDKLFYDLARKYIRDCPSHTPNARWFSHGFPEFLDGEKLVREVPAIAEIARIERALGDAFDAFDTVPVSHGALADLVHSGIEKARLKLHPSVTLLRLETNSYDAFRALRNEQDPPAVKNEDETRWLLVWRKDFTCRHMELKPEQGVLLDLARQGSGFEMLCEVSATMDGPDTAAIRMAGYLSGWIENELVTEIA